MKSSKKLSLVCYGITAIVYLLILIGGTLGSITGQEMGFAVLTFYMIMPVVSFVNALILGLKNAYRKWLYPIVFGALAFVIPWVIFGAPDIFCLFFSFIPAEIGLGIGVLIYKARTRKMTGKRK
ncbi:MAG: hypothetical protein LBR83_02525 [Clostridiales bacterium]|jgi:hypothetical protein|nr:hypothetical protein [Clostridiales bacterium]